MQNTKWDGMNRRKNKRIRGRKVFGYISTEMIILVMFYSLLLKYPEAFDKKWVVLSFLVSHLFNLLLFISTNAVEKLILTISKMKIFNKGE